MILEFLIDIVCSLIVGAVQGLNFVSIPMDGIWVLAEFTAYGSYVVGSDLLLVFSACVFFWMTVKLTVGIILFIWRLLPLT